MGNQTIGAIFCFVINQGVIPATLRQRIQRAITKQAVEVIIIFHLMAREIFTLVVSEKFRTVIHEHSCHSIRPYFIFIRSSFSSIGSDTSKRNKAVEKP